MRPAIRFRCASSEGTWRQIRRVRKRSANFLGIVLALPVGADYCKPVN
jgi:hypothetical protein